MRRLCDALAATDAVVSDAATVKAAGRNNSKSSSRSTGHARGTRTGQTRKKPKDLSVREGEERGRGEGGGVYAVCMR
jgi:hypothetical protein